MTGVDFDALFDQFAHSAFRLEARPTYNVGGQEAVRIAAYRARQARPERSVRTDPWLTRIAVTTAQGKQWRRLRVLDDPLTDYERYQLLSGTYIEAQSCGDQTVLVDRALAGPAAEFADFWLFDGGLPTAHGFLMHYTREGQFEGLVPAGVAELRAMQDIADRVTPTATPLAEYLAGMGVGVA